MDQNQLSDNDKVFFNDGLRLALAADRDGISKKSLLQTTRQAQDAIDGLVEALSVEAKRQNVTLDCKKGCSWCCHQAIFATSHEIHFMWEFMKLNFSEDDQKLVVQTAFDNYQKRGRMSEDELLADKLACPLLKNGSCSVYPARPLTCRIYLSMSEPSCKTFFDKPNDKNNFPQLFEFPLQAGRMLNEGLNSGLNETGLKSREMLLEEGLLLAHNNGEVEKDISLNELPLFNGAK
ncbi:YkgJ family cysteine cluster protein [Carboxylicivirga sp. N1Y90]|uniref:YkgJ family cysteine cluster protein n=1 Tax=Carboxylicivirga fragile TaxID=3417571 RepID=UPI003D325BA4|nr:YkgJ family cysteine cluster protein [Marinilabiliaceae bacterium N1Y90]